MSDIIRLTLNKGGNMVYIVNIRDRRQITLPADILNQLDLAAGDKLAIQVKKQKLVAKPIRVQAMDALKAIQKAFQKAKISEDELQKSGRTLRRKLTSRMYGK